MLRRLLIGIILVFLAVITPGLAQTEDKSVSGDNETDTRQPKLEKGQSGSPTLEEALKASAIRLSLVNGIVDFVKNTKQADVAIEWDLLAIEEKNLLETQRRFAGISDTSKSSNIKSNKCGNNSIKIVIPNTVLGSPEEWVNNLTREQQECLEAALGIRDLMALNSSEPRPDDSNFKAFWIMKSEPESGDPCQGFEGRRGCGRELLKGNITVPQYISLLRDHNIMLDFLRSKGIAYSLEVSNAEIVSPKVLQDNPLISYNDINWEISIYKNILDVGNEKKAPIEYYRFAVKARVKKPIRLLFRSSEEPKIGVEISFRDSLVTTGLNNYISYTSGSITKYVDFETEFSPEINTLLSEIRENQSGNRLDVFFRNISGIPFQRVVSRGILGGTENTSIITGGLIGSGEVQPLFGANLEFSQNKDFTPGLLFGLGPGGDNSTLFLGPSVRFSVFTLSAGARVFDVNEGTKIRPGGVISLDLSRAFGNKQDVNHIRLNNPSVGGDWSKVGTVIANDLSQNASLVDFTYEVPQNIEIEPPEITLWQVTDEAGKPIPINQPRALFKLKPVEGRLILLPKSKYAYQFELPQGYKLVAPICLAGSLQFREIASQPIPRRQPSAPQPSDDARAIADAITLLASPSRTTSNSSNSSNTSPTEAPEKPDIDLATGEFQELKLRLIQEDKIPHSTSCS
jgi:hypothetical protein